MDQIVYKLVAVFSSFIAVLDTDGYGYNLYPQWTVLTHKTLAPGSYVDAVCSGNLIFVVNSYRGEVFLWNPIRYG